MQLAKRHLHLVITLLALLAIALVWRMKVPGPKVAIVESHTPTVTSQNLQAGDSDASGQPKRSSATPPVLFTPEELSVQALQELLDDESKHQEALDKALAMASGSVREQIAAVDAFRWLGGRKAMRALIPLRNHAYASLADEASNVLNHLFSEGLYTGGIRRDDFPDDGIVILDEGLYDDELNDDNQRPDAELWLAAILQAPDVNAREALLIILAAYPIDQSVPIMLQLLDSPDAVVRDSVQGHLQSIIGGEEILSREQVEEWLAKNTAGASDQTETPDEQ